MKWVYRVFGGRGQRKNKANSKPIFNGRTQKTEYRIKKQGKINVSSFVKSKYEELFDFGRWD